jgi:hypothetical protein
VAQSSTEVRATDSINTPNVEPVFVGRHFQGASPDARTPGLKPWAILYSRFAANSPALRAGVVFADYGAPEAFDFA